MNYNQTITIERLHRIPRFGNTNDISVLASPDPQADDAYVNGAISFSVLLGLIVLLWGFTLLYLKLFFLKADLGWIQTGGKPIDIQQLREQKIPRAERKQRILRAWRLQSTFFCASLFIPVLSFLLMNRGFHVVMDSVQTVNEINHGVQLRATVGLQIANMLASKHGDIQSMGFASVVDDSGVTSVCNSQDLLGNVESTVQQVTQVVNDLLFFVEDHVMGTAESLRELLSASASLDDSIENTYQQEWAAKYFLILLNCLNALLFFGCVLTKNHVNSKQYQQLLTWILVPLFCLLIPICVVGFCVFLTGATVNADFCSGGADPGSPQATLQNMILQHGYSVDSLSYQSIDYFGNQCQGKNPVAFISVLAADVKISVVDIKSTASSILSGDLTSISSQCLSALESLVSVMLMAVSDILEPVSDSLDETKGVLRCSSLSPIFQDVYGVPCSEAPAALTWSFGTLLALTICAMVMLTTRAAMYNPIIQVKLKRRREKEFEDYRRFMSRYYKTDDWVLEPDKIKLEDQNSDCIPRVATFETENTDESKPSPLCKARGHDPSPTNESVMTSKLPIFEELHNHLNASDSDDDSYSYASEDMRGEDASVAESTNMSSAISLLVDRFFNVARKSKTDTSRMEPVESEPSDCMSPVPDGGAYKGAGSSEAGDSLSHLGQADDILNDSVYSLESSRSHAKAGLVRTRVQSLERPRVVPFAIMRGFNTMLSPQDAPEPSESDDGEIQMSMTSPGRGTDAAARQSDVSMESDIVTVASNASRRTKFTVRDLVETPYRRVQASIATIKPKNPPKKSLLGSMTRSDDAADDKESLGLPRAPQKSVKRYARTTGSKMMRG